MHDRSGPGRRGSVSDRIIPTTEGTLPKLRFTVRRLMLLVLGVALLLYLAGIGRGLTGAKVGRIRPGMTPGQVEAILGPPNPFPAPRGEQFWDENRLMGIVGGNSFISYFLGEYFRTENRLLGTRYVSVRVFYDSDGRVERVHTKAFWTSPWWKFW